MTVISGRKVGVTIGLESPGAPGTPVAGEYTYPQMDVSIVDKDTPLFDESTFNTNIKNSSKTTVLVEGDGSVSGNIYVKGIYYFLSLLFGQKGVQTDVELDVAAKQNVFTLLDSNEHLSATVGVKEANQDVRFPYAMPDSLSIKWAPGSFPTIEATFKSAKSVSGTTTLAYVVNEAKFLPLHAKLFIADTLTDLDAASVLTSIKSFEITFSKALSTSQTMDSGDTYGEIFPTDYDVTGSIEKTYRDTTYRGYALNDTVKSMRFSLIDTVNLAGTTTPTSLTFDLSRVAFSNQAPAYGQSDISNETIKFDMLLDKENYADSIKATLINKYDYAA